MAMKLSRFQEIYNGMNGTAKKVYDAIPMKDHWSVHKIMCELKRKGSIISSKGVNGCLGYMLSAGIIEQNKDGDYIRTAMKIACNTPDEPTPVRAATKEQITMATTPETTPANAFDILSGLASRARALAQRASDLEDDAAKLADDMEHAALTLAESTERETKELGKLRQLKQLLGSLAVEES